MLNEFIQNFTKAAHENGIQNLEFYSEIEKKVSVNAYQGRAWSSQLSEVTSCYVQGEYQGMTGAISIEDFSEEQFEEAIHFLKMTAEMNHIPCIRTDRNENSQRFYKQFHGRTGETYSVCRSRCERKVSEVA